MGKMIILEKIVRLGTKEVMWWGNKMWGKLLLMMNLIQTLTSHLNNWPELELNLKIQRI